MIWKEVSVSKSDLHGGGIPLLLFIIAISEVVQYICCEGMWHRLSVIIPLSNQH